MRLNQKRLLTILTRRPGRFRGHNTRKSKQHLMRKIGIAEQWVPAPQPHIVGQCKFAQPRTFGLEGIVAVIANEYFLIAVSLQLRDTPLVQEDLPVRVCGANP